MKFHLVLILGLALLGTVAFVACNKDNDKPKDVFEKKGLVISGDQEVPVKTVPGSGTMDVSYNKTTKILTMYATWSGLTGDPAGAHIHGPAAKGVNAGVKIHLESDVTLQSGTFTKSIPIDEISVKEDSLLAGFYYFNIHTSANPGGEIRGQIEF